MISAALQELTQLRVYVDFSGVRLSDLSASFEEASRLALRMAGLRAASEIIRVETGRQMFAALWNVRPWGEYDAGPAPRKPVPAVVSEDMPVFAVAFVLREKITATSIRFEELRCKTKTG